MPNKNYLRGRRLEWQVKKDLEDKGYHVMRTAGSHGAYDLVAIRYTADAPHIKFIQCKVVKAETEAVVKRLLKELKDTSPIKYEVDADVIIDVELVVKQHGDASYETYPLES